MGMAPGLENEVLIVGGGQAGLALAYYLREAEVGFAVVDSGPRVGHVWRSRWDSLRLFTPAQYAHLPGLAFPAAPDTYPRAGQVADYLEAYARHFELPVRMRTTVDRLVRIDGGFMATTTAGEEIRARQVVVATGPFSRPYVPRPLASGLAPEVVEVHTADYRNLTRLPEGAVLVVGGGNSGFQVAAELAATGRPVTLAEGRRNACVPQRVLGRDIFWWQDRLGLLRVTADSSLGRRMKANDGTVIGSRRRDLVDVGITLRPRLAGTDGRIVRFEDGTTTEVSAVVWATGFTVDDTWIDIPDVLDQRGCLMQQRGVVTGAASLYTLGRRWQHTTGSALLGFVHHDAEWLCHQITRRARTQKRT